MPPEGRKGRVRVCLSGVPARRWEGVCIRGWAEGTGAGAGAAGGGRGQGQKYAICFDEDID